jgi:thioesterase domain-containing protein/acyl carrier protein
MMYRTGDLGRMGADMNMEFIGRKDSQVKIRGFRVELGEIESVLAQSGVVQHAVVLAKKDSEGVNRLVAYVVPNRMYEQEIAAHHVKTKLPDYMMPAVWVELKELPLTSNGKIDKKALPEFDASEQIKTVFVPAKTQQEIQYAHLWKEVLGVERVGVTDNFFNLGGQSLLAVSMLSELERITNRKLPIAVLFKYPTIQELAKFINEDKAEARWKCLVPIKATGHKMPVYLIHGDGMNVANFSNLANYMDADQPVYSLQPLGLEEQDAPQDNMADIAAYYIKEIMENDPEGPYAIAGYSFGGYLAVEMRQQLVAMGKEVKLIAIFDTNAQNTEYTKGWVEKLPRRIKRQVPKFMFIVRSFMADPKEVIGYQKLLLSKKINNVSLKLGIAKPVEAKGFDLKLMRINDAHLKAFRNFRLPLFDGKVVLFKAKKRVYFVDDMETLGWPKYAQKGVEVKNVPGDHKTMFLPPNVQVLAKLLQESLDKC